MKLEDFIDFDVLFFTINFMIFYKYIQREENIILEKNIL